MKRIKLGLSAAGQASPVRGSPALCVEKFDEEFASVRDNANGKASMNRAEVLRNE